MPKTYNFSNPMYGRKWLRLLREDPVSGIRILPNLDLPSRNLGFSFRSNSLGLRGPSNVSAPNVVIGTSFAMGFAVDNGLNWYEKCLDGMWLNLGLPVGMRQIEALFNAEYQGPARTALVLYHPNTWMQTRVLEPCHTRGVSTFKAMSWQVGFWPCLKLYLRRLRWRWHDIRKGKLLVFRHGGLKYEMTALYNNFDFDANVDIVAIVPHPGRVPVPLSSHAAQSRRLDRERCAWSGINGARSLGRVSAELASVGGLPPIVCGAR